MSITIWTIRNGKIYRKPYLIVQKNFNSDIHYFTLGKNKNFDWNAYSDEKEKIRKEIKQLMKEAKEKLFVCGTHKIP